MKVWRLPYMDNFKIGDHIISKDIMLRYPKPSEIWIIVGEDTYKDGTERWELRKDLGVACYGKEFVAEEYIKYDPAIEILYG